MSSTTLRRSSRNFHQESPSAAISVAENTNRRIVSRSMVGGDALTKKWTAGIRKKAQSFRMLGRVPRACDLSGFMATMLSQKKAAHKPNSNEWWEHRL